MIEIGAMLAELGGFRAKFDRTLAIIRRIRARLGQILGHFWPSFLELGPIFADAGPRLVILGRCRARFDRIRGRGGSGQSWLGPKPVEPGASLADHGHFLPMLVHVGLVSRQLRQHECA